MTVLEGEKEKKRLSLSFSEKKNVVNHHCSTFIKISHYLFQPSPSFILKYVKANPVTLCYLLLQNNGENDHFSLTFFLMDQG